MRKQRRDSSRDDESKTGTVTNIVDLTGRFKSDFGITKSYHLAYEHDLARYAVTIFVNEYGHMVRDARNVSNAPQVVTMTTGVRMMTQVFKDVCAIVEVEVGGKKYGGMIQAIQIDDFYRVSIAAFDSSSTDVLESCYNDILESSNFFQGKSLRFSDTGVEFIPTPTTTLEDTILPVETIKEYQLNVLDFLSNKEMQTITKKRGVILHGPPGTGKTSSVKAFFNILQSKNITCIYISDASFERHSVEQVFLFINKYLAPCLVVFEDIDLVAMDRRMGTSRIIGSLLSAMNGIEEQEKPIVIVATTNRPEVLDAAVTRPCRFDRKIKVDYPSTKELENIFRKISGFDAPKGMFHQPEEDAKKLTGAHVEEIYRTAALLSKSKKAKIVDCVLEAYETVKKHFMLVNPRTIKGFDYDDDNLSTLHGEMPRTSSDDPFNS